MSRQRGRQSGRWGARALVVTVAAVALAGCGLPGEGSRRVDGDTVPYGLLAPEGPRSPAAAREVDPDVRAPLVFWVDGDDRLVPATTGDTCSADTGELVAGLLDQLASGPTDELRATGRTSAWATPTVLELVDVDGATAVVAIESGAQTTADRLPLALGQAVLTLATAPGVTGVAFVDADGAPLPVPLPGGALTEDPVAASDYASLLDEPSASDAWPGCT